MAKKTKWTFEERMTRLDEIAMLLEDGQLTVEEGLKIFEEGVNHYKKCQEVLVEAENKIELLSDNGGMQ